MGLAVAVIASRGHTPSEIEISPQLLTAVAVGFAIGSIISHRIAALQSSSPHLAARLGLVSLGFAVATGAVGVAMAWLTGDLRSGLLFTIAGAIFCLRPVTRPENTGSAGD